MPFEFPWLHRRGCNIPRLFIPELVKRAIVCNSGKKSNKFHCLQRVRTMQNKKRMAILRGEIPTARPWPKKSGVFAPFTVWWKMKQTRLQRGGSAAEQTENHRGPGGWSCADICRSDLPSVKLEAQHTAHRWVDWMAIFYWSLNTTNH